MSKEKQRFVVPGWAWIAVALLSTWGWLLYSVHFFWSKESYYSFGWFVPFLTGFILYRRLKEADFSLKLPPDRIRRVALWGSLAATVAMVFLFRLVIEVNPFWRVPFWMWGITLLMESYFVIWLLTGWRGVKHFAFPMFFMLLALPWPLTIEVWIIQSLTRWVTDLTVVFINLIGYPALAMGNNIAIGDVRVGVDEACSGIRSLQSLVMVAFFLGEFFAYGAWRRLLLLGGAVGISLVFNGARAVMLTLITINGTQEKFDFWHDFLGNFNAVIGALLLFALAELINQLVANDKPAAAPRADPAPTGAPLQVRTRVLALACMFGMGELLVHGYYAFHKYQYEPLPQLALNWPDNSFITHSPTEFPERSQEILQCEYSSQADIRWTFGMEATVVYYGYSGEDLARSLGGYGHSPLICMASIGAKLVEEKQPLQVDIQGIPWRANHYEFSFDLPNGRKQKTQVFWLVWEQFQQGVSSYEFENRSLWSNRLAPVLKGRRDFSRQVLLVYFHGDYGDEFLRNKFSDLIGRVAVLEEQD